MPPESRTLTLSLDEHTVALASEALRGEADRRRRAGIALSAELTDKKRTEGADIRTASGQVVAVLAEAASLTDAADQLSDAWDAGKPAKRPNTGKRAPKAPAPPEAPSSGPDDDETEEEHDDDLDDVIDPAQHADGSTVTDHADDPDVIAARAQLGLPDGPPVGVAPSIPPVD